MNCEDTTIIPEFSHFCFNTILMVMFFSQNSRKLLLTKIDNWNKPFSLFIKKIILSFYINRRKTQHYLSVLNPEDLLFNIVSSFIKLKSYIKTTQAQRNIKKIDWNDYFMIDFYKSLGISCLDITYYNGKFYLDLYKKLDWGFNKNNQLIPQLNRDKNVDKMETNPDILLIFDNVISIDLTKIQSTQLSIPYPFQKEIKINDVEYVLDSIILNSTKAGITCEDERFVYNNWNNTNSKTFPCSIKKFDWTKESQSCINPYECKLDIKEDIDDIKDLCFDFQKGKRTFVYIRKNKIERIDDSFLEDLVKKYKKEEIIYNIPNILELVKRIDVMELSQLITEINKLTEKQISPSYSSDISILKKLYFDLFVKINYKEKKYNEEISQEIPEEIPEEFPEEFQEEFPQKNPQKIPKEIPKEIQQVLEEQPPNKVAVGGYLRRIRRIKKYD